MAFIEKILIPPQTNEKTVAQKYPEIAVIECSGEKVPFIHIFSTVTFHFSEINSKDKYSYTFEGCLCLIVRGIETTTGNYISFLGHLSPNIGKQECVPYFLVTFREKLELLLTKCDPASVTATVGGSCDRPRRYRRMYRVNIAAISSVLSMLSVQIQLQLFSPKRTLDTLNNFYLKNDTGILYDHRVYKNKKVENLVSSEITKEMLASMNIFGF